MCRQVVVAMDKEKTSLGRLGYPQFKDLIVSLKLWQGVFRSIYSLLLMIVVLTAPPAASSLMVVLVEHPRLWPPSKSINRMHQSLITILVRVS